MAAGVALEARREKRFVRTGTALVSIVIPARNESARIRPLFAALSALTYTRLEFVFIDDRSSDDTAALIDAFVASRPDGSARLLRLTENPGPNFKQFALARGIEAARGELLLFTDADCVFAPDWASAMAAALGDEKTGLAIGPVFKPVAGPRFFDFYQALDHAVRYAYLVGSAGLGVPTGGFGNNLIVRRAALEKLGGYDTVPFSPTEDAALIGCVRSRTKYRVRGLVSEASRVVTTPETSFREFARQGLRWNNGGLFAPDLATRLAFNYLMVIIALGVLFLPVIAFVPSLWPLSFCSYFAITVDTLCSAYFARGMLPRPYWKWIPHSFLTPAYFGLLTILGYLGIQVSWKGASIPTSDAVGEK